MSRSGLQILFNAHALGPSVEWLICAELKTPSNPPRQRTTDHHIERGVGDRRSNILRNAYRKEKKIKQEILYPAGDVGFGAERVKATTPGSRTCR